MREVAILLAMAVITPIFAAVVALTPIYTGTRYAPGYSEWQFKQVKAGASESQVRSALGKPLIEVTNAPGTVTLLYSRPDHRYFVLYWKSRGIVVSNGVGISKWSFADTM